MRPAFSIIIAAVFLGFCPGSPAGQFTFGERPPPALSDQWGFGGAGSNYGSVGISNYFQSVLSGCSAEFQRAFILPQPITIDHVETGTSLGEVNYFELALYNPTFKDSRLWSRFRNAERGDLELAFLDNRWYDRPNASVSFRKQGELTAYMRAWKSPLVEGKVYLVSEGGERSDRQCDSVDTEYEICARAVTPGFDALVSGSVGSFRDKIDPGNDMDRYRLELSIFKPLGRSTNAEFYFAHGRTAFRDNGDAVRELEMKLAAVTYGPFSVPGMRLRAGTRYYLRPSSFVENNESNSLFESSVSMLYFTGRASFSAGVERRRYENDRLDRVGVDEILSQSGTPRKAIEEHSLRDYPVRFDTWTTATLDGRRFFRLSIKYRDVFVRDILRSDWVSAGSAQLYPSATKRLDYTLNLAPLNPVNMRIFRSHEVRRWHDSMRDVDNSDLRCHTHYLFNFDCFRGLALSMSKADYDIAANGNIQDDDINGDVTSLSFHGAYDLNEAFALSVDHNIIHSRGSVSSRERILSYGIEYDPGKARAFTFSIAFGIDQFDDHDDSSNSFRAKTVTISSESRF